MRKTAAFFILCLAFSAQSQTYPPIYNASVVQGSIGDTLVKLYLGPSPYIQQGALDFISSATGKLDVCAYEFDLPLVAEKLLEVHERGVNVRLAVPPDAAPSKSNARLCAAFNQLISHKILRYTRNLSGLMHNKFMVADGIAIWTGSYNLSRNDTEWNDNNAIVLSNRLLAVNYTTEFNEIWTGRHGKRKSDPTPYPRVQIGPVEVQNYFAPEDDLSDVITREILKATNSVYVMAFALTDENIFNALSNRIAAKVSVQTLFDLDLSRQKSSKALALKAAGGGVRISANNGQMHHKVIVIDERVVITGSANFSANAFGVNDENILIFSCPPLARAIKKEFYRCWMARPYIYNKWSLQVPPM